MIQTGSGGHVGGKEGGVRRVEEGEISQKWSRDRKKGMEQEERRGIHLGRTSALCF